MCIRFKVEGGIAYFPGLSRPMTLDVEELPPEEAHRVRKLVETARFFQQPSQAPRRGADLQKYVITVQEGDREHTVVLSDPISDPELCALVNYLRGRR
jgi:hypothetical protein